MGKPVEFRKVAARKMGCVEQWRELRAFVCGTSPKVIYVCMMLVHELDRVSVRSDDTDKLNYGTGDMG